MEKAQLPPHVRRKIGALANVAEGTSRKFFKGGAVRPIIRERLMEVARQLGVADLMPPEVPLPGAGQGAPRNRPPGAVTRPPAHVLGEEG